MSASEPLTIQPPANGTDATETPAPRGNLGRRVGAALFDLALVAGPIVVMALTQARALTGTELFRIGLTTGQVTLGWTDRAIAVTATCGLLWAFIVLALVPANAGGATPGLRLAGLRVVSLSGAPASVHQHLVRTVVGIVDLVPFVVPGFLGTLVVIAHRDLRRLGDRVAGTRIVEGTYQQPLPTGPLPADAHEHTGGTPVDLDLTHEASTDQSEQIDPAETSAGTDDTSDDDRATVEIVSALGVDHPTRGHGQTSDDLDTDKVANEADHGPTEPMSTPEWHESLGAWVYRDATTGGLFCHDVDTDRWLPVGVGRYTQDDDHGHSLEGAEDHTDHRGDDLEDAEETATSVPATAESTESTQELSSVGR